MAVSMDPYRSLFRGRFSSGRSDTPGVVLGRDDIVERFMTTLSVASQRGRVFKGLVVVGLPGMGKTSVLSCARRRAASDGWSALELSPKGPLADLASFVGTEDIKAGLAQMVQSGERVLVCLDDAGEADVAELDALASAMRGAAMVSGDVAFAMALTPGAADGLKNREGCLYFRKLGHETLSLLTSKDAKRRFMAAFDGPCAVSPTALESLFCAGRGHPFLLQLLGCLAENRVASLGPGGYLDIDGGREVEVEAISTYCDEFLSSFADFLGEEAAESLRDLAGSVDSAGILQSRGGSPGRISRLVKAGILVPVVGYRPGRYRVAVPYLAEWLRGEIRGREVRPAA